MFPQEGRIFLPAGQKKICNNSDNAVSYRQRDRYIAEMKLDGAMIRALRCAAERCGGAVNLSRRSGIDPGCISRYLRGRVRSVSDENWSKLKKFLQTVNSHLFQEDLLPVIEWKELLKDPELVRRDGGVEELVLRARGLQMAPGICDRDLIFVRRLPDLQTAPENRIVVAVFDPQRGKQQRKAVCRRLRKINDGYWFFSDEPQGLFFSAECEEIIWIGVVLRKISEL